MFLDMALYAKQMQAQEKHYLSRSYPIEGSNDSLSDSTLVNISEGLYWNKGSKIKNLKEIDFWIGKRAQVGK